MKTWSRNKRKNNFISVKMLLGRVMGCAVFPIPLTGSDWSFIGFHGFLWGFFLDKVGDRLLCECIQVLRQHHNTASLHSNARRDFLESLCLLCPIVFFYDFRMLFQRPSDFQFF